MTTSVEQSPGGSPWRKRHHEDLSIDLQELKRPRNYYFRLESESSKASDDGSESVYSVQGKETDVVRDTSDTETQYSEDKGDVYDLEFEYDVASLSENDEIEVSTTDSEGMILAAAAAVICDNSLESWVTDVEDSDSSSETSLGRSDFSICVQCKGENRNPLYRYCEKCFQARKKIFPPRPRRNRRKKQAKAIQEEEEPVKLDTLRNCLSGLSQDSGIGSSQDCPVLGLDQIRIPEYLQNPEKKRKGNTVEISSSGTSQSEDISPRSEFLVTKHEHAEPESTKSNELSGKEPTLKRKRHSSESSLSDFDVKRPKIASKSEHPTSDLGSEVNSTSSFTSSISSFSSETSGFHSERSGSITLEKSSSFDSAKSDSELCMFCNSAPKNSIFLHTNMAHRCCCYPCAKKTLKSIKRCPICNGSVNKVVKMFTS